MASAQSSQDMRRGRDRQPPTLGSPRPRHRSESRRLSDIRRPAKAVACKSDHCPGALHEGDIVRVFSRSADKWLNGEVVRFVEHSFVRVEYEVGKHRYGKVLHVHSDCLADRVEVFLQRTGTWVVGHMSLGDGPARFTIEDKTPYQLPTGTMPAPPPEQYARKARMADFLASKAVARQGGAESTKGLQLIDTAVRRLEQRGCRNHQLPGYDGKSPFTIVTNDDLRLHHIDSETQQNIDWLPEYTGYARMTKYGVLVIGDSAQSFRDWLLSGACQRETEGLPDDRLWILQNDGDKDHICSVVQARRHHEAMLDQALCQSVKEGKVKNMKRALEMRANPNAPDGEKGLCPLTYAITIHGESSKVANLLLQDGARMQDHTLADELVRMFGEDPDACAEAMHAVKKRGLQEHEEAVQKAEEHCARCRGLKQVQNVEEQLLVLMKDIEADKHVDKTLDQLREIDLELKQIDWDSVGECGYQPISQQFFKMIADRPHQEVSLASYPWISKGFSRIDKQVTKKEVQTVIWDACTSGQPQCLHDFVKQNILEAFEATCEMAKAGDQEALRELKNAERLSIGHVETVSSQIHWGADRVLKEIKKAEADRARKASPAYQAEMAYWDAHAKY